MHNWDLIFEEMGKKRQTTFGYDFDIADNFGCAAVQDTFNRAFTEWKDNYIYLTELVLILNLKIWQWHDKDNDFAKIYNDLWEKADGYACENLQGVELAYFYDMTD
jgi:hypothetical protein